MGQLRRICQSSEGCWSVGGRLGRCRSNDWYIPRDFAGREAKLGVESRELNVSFQSDEML